VFKKLAGQAIVALPRLDVVVGGSGVHTGGRQTRRVPTRLFVAHLRPLHPSGSGMTSEVPTTPDFIHHVSDLNTEDYPLGYVGQIQLMLDRLYLVDMSIFAQQGLFPARDGAAAPLVGPTNTQACSSSVGHRPCIQLRFEEGLHLGMLWIGAHPRTS
jgi:hypothetical protein